MNSTPQQWGSYFAYVNGKLASIALNLALQKKTPMAGRSVLLWVWTYFKSPKPNGLSDQSEFEVLASIEDALTEHLGVACDALEAGRITTDGHREFYFYGSSSNGFEPAVKQVFAKFNSYKFDLGCQDDSEWNQYLNVLYPSEEDFEKMKNQDVLNVLMEHGDTLSPVRDVHHWIYFRTAQDRRWFASTVTNLGYKIENEQERSEQKDDVRPLGLQITRDQSVTPDQIDEAVVELFRLAKQVDAHYDGWETQIIATKH